MNRLRRAAEFQAVLRGRRTGRSRGELFVVHVGRVPRPVVDTAVPRVGLVVSKAVGNSVRRSRAKRVLRHVASARLGDLPTDIDIVVRAHAALLEAGHDRVVADFDRQLQHAVRRAS